MKNRRIPSPSYRRKPVPTADLDSGARQDTKKPRFAIEELVVGMTPENEPPPEDDWPVGDELI